MTTGKVLTVLVEWLDHSAIPFWHPPAAYDSLLYSDGISDQIGELYVMTTWRRITSYNVCYTKLLRPSRP